MRPIVVGVILSATTVLVGCGDDGLAEDEFVEDLVAYSVPEDAARCVYAEIADDEDVIADIRENGVEDDVSSATADRLEAALTDCLRGPQTEEDSPSTTEDR